MAQVIVLQMKQNRSRVAHSSQGTHPLRPVVDVHEIELSNSPDQRPQPQLLFTAPRYRDSAYELAGAPRPAALVWKWIEVIGTGRKTENRDIDFVADPAVDFVSPASQSAAVVGAELLAARQQYCHGWLSSLSESRGDHLQVRLRVGCHALHRRLSSSSRLRSGMDCQNDCQNRPVRMPAAVCERF